VAAFDGPDGTTSLAAYLVARGTASTPAVRSFLRERLPDYLVPSDFVWVDALPRTVQGKVDRRALPRPERSRSLAEGDYAAPRTPRQELIAGIWAEVLQVKSVGIHDNFFDLGGHSLLATQALARMREALRAEIPLRRLYEKPTVAELAESLGGEMEEGDL
jgi:hypothetical protein